ncbi:12631_t:CDS:10 [Entrophospora sp. SA101]|nr:12631_t:CDS:10 [Entrophospora sp. SA101]CAJ0843877.1 15351_t:CDS:10 [Entrophospora sp. SA101]CAJ0850213.1 8895_t:CDS:10 [Entrophospora sp. SA101]
MVQEKEREANCTHVLPIEGSQTTVPQQLEPNVEAIDYNKEVFNAQDTSSFSSGNLQTTPIQIQKPNIDAIDYNEEVFHAQETSISENSQTGVQQQEPIIEAINYKEVQNISLENIQTDNQQQKSNVIAINYKNELPPTSFNAGNGTAEFSDAIAKVKAMAAKLLDNASTISTEESNVAVQGHSNINIPSNHTTIINSTNNMNDMDINLNKAQQGIKRSHEDTYNPHESKDSHDDRSDDYRGDLYKGRERYDEYGRVFKRTAYDVGSRPEYDGSGSRSRYGFGGEERRSHYDPGNDINSASAEEFKVPNAVVGLVIGRGGENLKRIEKTTGARIQFSQDQPPDMIERHVKVTGLADDVKIARAMIQKLVEDARNGSLVNRRDSAMNGQNKNTVIIRIPSNKVGVVIGRKGETIRDLQDRSGAHINVTPDSAASPQSKNRPVTLIGDDEAIQRAKALINEIINNGEISSEINHHQDHRPNSHNSGSGSYNNHGGNYMNHNSNSGHRNQESITIKVPNDSVGLIIGKGGETVRALQQKSGAKIQIEPVYGGVPPIERNVQIIGSAENIAIAKSLILEKAASGNRERSSRHNGEQGRNGQQQNKHQSNNYQHQSSTANSDISVYQQTGYSTNAYPTQSQPNTYGQLITNDYTQISTTNYPVAASTYVPSGQQATMIYNQQRQYNPSQTTSSYQYLTQPQYGTYPQNIQYAQSTTGQSTTQSAVQVSMQTIGQSAIQSTGQLQANYYQTAPNDPTKVATTGADNKTDNTSAPAPNYGYQQIHYNYNVPSATIQYPSVAGQTHAAISSVYPTLRLILLCLFFDFRPLR